MPSEPVAKKRSIQLLHAAAPGRARYEIRALYRSKKAAHWIMHGTVRLPGVQRAHANPLTGTLLVEFLPQILSQKKLRRHLKHIVRDGREARFKSALQENHDSAWHQLSVKEIISRTHSDSVHGLTRLRAIRSRKLHGPNQFKPPTPPSKSTILLHQFENLPTTLLLGSAALSLATGGLLDAAFIVSVIAFNSGIGFWMEQSTEKTITAITQRSRYKARVIRAGHEILLPFEDVVVGDLLVLRAGERVPADARLLKADRLTLDESILTGESMPVEKNANPESPSGLIYRGTFVSGGSATAMVVAVGWNTEIGKIQRLMETQTHPLTPMQQQLEQLTNQLILTALLASGGVLAVGLLRGRRFVDLLKTSMSLAVAAIPESLPTVATLTLGRGVTHLEQEGILVRRLDSVETFASVDMVCFDKTGTITLNRMEVRWIQTLRSSFDPQENRSWPKDPAIRQILEVGSLCNETTLEKSAEKLSLGGSSTEKALLELARAGGLQPELYQKKHPRTRIKDRSEGRNYMVTEHAGKKARLAVKGSPEEVLKLCSHYLDGKKQSPLTPETRKRILEQNSAMAAEQLRVLGFADGQSENQLTWLGLVGMKDPIRPGVKTLVERLHSAGIDTCMITGDQEGTAQAVAESLGIRRCYGRVSPARKLAVVRELQNSGRVVAMVGDGVNDGPALRSADIGIAMGAQGIEVAAQAADLVLPTDNLGAVIHAVREGRTVHQDIHKAVDYIISQNLSEIAFTFASVALGNATPLSSLQFLWVNLITDIFPELAIAQEPPEDDVLGRGPHHRNERIFSRRDAGKALFESIILASAPLGTHLYSRMSGKNEEEAKSLAFLTLTGSSLFYTLSARSETRTVFDRKKITSNPYIGMAIGAGFAAELLSILIPPLRRALYTRRVTGRDLLTSTAVSAAPMLVIETSKYLQRKKAA